MARRYHLVLPDLGFGDRPIHASLWLVGRGARVCAGDAILEVVAGSATVDLPSPADGVLVRRRVAEGDTLTVGQRLAVIAEEEDK